MKNKSSIRHFDKLLVIILIITFFLYNFKRIDYGLPFFLNLDEIAFQYSSLFYLSFITGYSNIIDPIYAPLLNLILILKSVFINEFILNSLSISQIKSKIYFNPELFILYGRIASLITTSLSIFFLFLIFKKLKIKFFIYLPLIISLCTSLVILDVAIVNGKHSYYLLFFLIQLYFFYKYLIKIERFDLKSYFIFSLLGSIAWGISYWPAFISIYAVFILHLRKFKFTKIHYPIIFSIIFLIFGPILGAFISNAPVLDFLITKDEFENLEVSSFYSSSIRDFIEGLKIIYIAEKNFFLLILFLPFILLKKDSNFKKDFLIVLVIFFEPIILLAIAGEPFPQLRYFVGNACIILILTSIVFNEINKTDLKYLYIIFLVCNVFFIYKNINVNYEVNKIVSKKHSFYTFNNSINIDKKKILYLTDLGFQENLKHNKLYLNLYKNNLIIKNKDYKINLERIKDKINKIENSADIKLINKKIKKDIIYFNYTFHQIKNLEMFFDYIKNYFEYVVIEESRPFYLSSDDLHNNIKKYVHNNFEIEKIYTDESKIFLRTFRSILHFYSNALNRFDYAKNIENKNLDIIYGSNYSLYKLN